MKQYIYLTLAILLGLVGSAMLKYCDGFTIFWPTILAIVSYFVAFYFFSLSLRTLPLSVGYATWSGVSTALNAVLGLIFFNESMSLMKILALVLVIGGIVLINNTNKPEEAEAETVLAASVHTL